MEPLRFHITGPDTPHKDQRLPWRLVVYQWKESYNGIIAAYVTLGMPMEFKTLAQAVARVKQIQHEKQF